MKALAIIKKIKPRLNVKDIYPLGSQKDVKIDKKTEQWAEVEIKIIKILK